jgi:hypothetical protein
MTVADPTTIDQLASGPDGRLLLAMTEDRPYRSYQGAPDPAMVEQFRAKLNAYVYLIRSGQLAQLPNVSTGAGVDIVLYSLDEPPDDVREMISLADRSLAGENVRVRAQLLPPPGPDELLRHLAEGIVGRCPQGWQRVDVSVVLVGGGISGDMAATLDDGRRVAMDPDASMIGALEGLKRALWSPDTGTWISAQFRIEVAGQIHPSYNFADEIAAGVLPDEQFATELERYPRAQVPDWWRARLPH